MLNSVLCERGSVAVWHVSCAEVFRWSGAHDAERRRVDGRQARRFAPGESNRGRLPREEVNNKHLFFFLSFFFALWNKEPCETLKTKWIVFLRSFLFPSCSFFNTLKTLSWLRKSFSFNKDSEAGVLCGGDFCAFQFFSAQKNFADLLQESNHCGCMCCLTARERCSAGECIACRKNARTSHSACCRNLLQVLERK